MRISIKRKKIIILINKNEINIIITTLVQKIKFFLKIKCKFNSKIEEINKIL